MLASKRQEFTYKLARVVVGFNCLIVLMLFFVEVPESNQRIVDMVLGVIVGSGLVSVINFYFQLNETELKEELSKDNKDDSIH
jgi:cadmium resistance protein CadD (predicted permease)